MGRKTWEGGWKWSMWGLVVVGAPPNRHAWNRDAATFAGSHWSWSCRCCCWSWCCCELFVFSLMQWRWHLLQVALTRRAASLGILLTDWSGHHPPVTAAAQTFRLTGSWCKEEEKNEEEEAARGSLTCGKVRYEEAKQSLCLARIRRSRSAFCGTVRYQSSGSWQLWDHHLLLQPEDKDVESASHCSW